jgi:hypothetical protein
VSPASAGGEGSSGERFEVDRDGEITPQDALVVIDQLADHVAAANVGLTGANGNDEKLGAVDEFLSDQAFLNGLFDQSAMIQR